LLINQILNDKNKKNQLKKLKSTKLTRQTCDSSYKPQITSLKINGKKITKAESLIK
jgi:hypothetical protein